MKRISQILYLLTTFYSLLGGFLGLGFGLLPYTLLKQIGDRLSKDGNLKSFTPSVYSHLHLGVFIAGLLLLCAGLFFITHARDFKNLIARILMAAGKIITSLISDARKLGEDFLAMKFAKWEWPVVMGIIVLAGLLRIPWMNRPLEYDEAYTFNELARHSLSQVISDYSLPNNHIFHTILVHFSFLIFGNQAWVIRLPVLISGLLLIPCVYLLTRRFYSRMAALLAAGLVTTFPYLILKSATARGYMLIALLTVMGLLLGEYLVSRKNNLGLLLWSLCIALGFYTNPSMVYPFAALFLWLMLKTISPGPAFGYASRREWITYTVSYTLLAGALTIFFYLPVLLSKGFVFFFNGARTVESLPFSLFLTSFPDVLKLLAQEWEFLLPAWMALVLAAGFVLTLVFSLRDRRGGTLLLASFPLGVGAVLLVQRPDSIPRIWLWALPILIIWAAAGLSNGLSWIAQIIRFPKQVRTAILTGIVLIFLINATSEANQQAKTSPLNSDEINVTLYLKSMVTPEDIVIVPGHVDALYWYYFTYYHLPEISIRNIKNRPFNQAFVVVYPGYFDETFEKDLTANGPDYGFPDLNKKILLTQIGGAVVYEIDPDPSIMQKLFGQSP